MTLAVDERPNRRKVLFVCYGRPFGGAELYTGRLAQLLGDNIECSALSGTPELTSYLQSLNLHVIGYPWFFKKGQLWNIEFLFVTFWLLPYLRLTGKADTVWIQGFREGFVLPIAWLMRYTTVATMHMTLGRRFSQFFYPYMLLFADRVICVSRTVAGSLPAFVRGPKVSVVNNWAQEVAIVRQASQSNDRLRLLYVGRLIKYKGATDLISAYKILALRYPNTSISLEIVGDGDERTLLEQQAADCGISFSGFQKNTSDSYLRSDVLINPSHGPEGSPLVNLEAMAYGLPLILSDLDVHQEISENGYYAKLFKRGDVEDLVARVEEFLISKEEVELFSRRSLEAIQTRFSAHAASAGYLQALTKITESTDLVEANR